MSPLDGLAAQVAARLTVRGDTIAVSESSTGGMIAAALVRVPGASAFFLGGAVVYTAHARQGLMGVDAAAMAHTRSASEPYAALMADAVRTRCAATWGLSETGASGPTGNRYGDAAGHCCVAVSGPAPAVATIETGTADRAANMEAFACAALRLLLQRLG